jgi:hypothetical protein
VTRILKEFESEIVTANSKDGKVSNSARWY